MSERQRNMREGDGCSYVGSLEGGSDFITYFVSGIALGCTFALIGSGFVVIHRVTRVVNFAQGTFAVFGGFISYSLLDGVLPQGLAQLVTVVACGLIGLVVGVVAIGKPGTDPLIALIVTLGVSIFCAAIFITAWGQDPVSPPGLSGSVSILGADVQRQRLLVVAATLLTFVALSLFFSRTYVGKGLTACASNPARLRSSGSTCGGWVSSRSPWAVLSAALPEP